ncbi:twin-arginine translocation signal domain-containing protein [Chromobacterium sp. IIBBL 290-4]|uniref:twin-arginine translocation signal domain-containing protein n=1 Tax=Chromobacterium sp. IIBBL 290-4 TaxID=2953890 RepID=UPI0020B8B914|nr:twin-arginine translocation signal domain-containing protein [Chromobacterium sp. IIBBL 290-4]UTH73738.1 twin-arginine translocation signal domain-containing protein [Chromobacterium sp. IIBBL 290-4]
MLSRRRFLTFATLGGVAVAAYWATPAAEPGAYPSLPAGIGWLNQADAQLVAILAPVMLGVPNLPVATVVAGVDKVIRSLPESSRKEIRQLFDLLENRWARRWLAGVRRPWRKARAEYLARFLQRWRTSRFQLKRSVYQGLHQLINAAWYGNPDSWAGLGYSLPQHVVRALP